MIKKINLPKLKQRPGTCGPTSLRMVLAYYGIKKTENELKKLTKCVPKYGTRSKDILLAAKKLGLDGYVQDFSTFDDLRSLYRKKIPTIVNWFSVVEAHYSPLVKIDDKYIWLMDPETASEKKISLETFQHIWFDTPRLPMKSKKDFAIRRLIAIYPKK